MDTEWGLIYGEIEDLLAPQLGLDPWERSIYYHLLRHTRLKGQTSGLFAVGPLSTVLPISDFKVRQVLRSLHTKGCVKIEDRSKNGHLIHVLLPSEIPSLSRVAGDASKVRLDIETLDFFTGHKYVAALLDREHGACFYCLRSLSADDCELDHLIPQAEVADNSYRNIVVSCYNCNKAKSSLSPADFIRKLYRSGILGEAELRNRLELLDAIATGKVVPAVEKHG